MTLLHTSFRSLSSRGEASSLWRDIIYASRKMEFTRMSCQYCCCVRKIRFCSLCLRISFFDANFTARASKISQRFLEAGGIFTVVILPAGILNVRILNAGTLTTGNCTVGNCTAGICTVLKIGILTAGNCTVVLNWKKYRRNLYHRILYSRTLYRRNLHHPCQAT